MPITIPTSLNGIKTWIALIGLCLLAMYVESDDKMVEGAMDYGARNLDGALGQLETALQYFGGAALIHKAQKMFGK